MNWKVDQNKEFKIDASIIKEYFNKTADLVFTDDAAKNEEAVLLQFIPDGNIRVLDLGCGNGRWASVLKNKVSKYVGIDFSEVFINQAKKRFQDGYFHFICAPADEFNISEKFDLILMVGLMTYLNDEQIEKMVSSVKSMLSNNGRLIVRNVGLSDEKITRKIYNRKIGFIQKILGRKSYQLIRRNPENEMIFFSNFKLISKGSIKNTGYVYYIFTH